MAKFKRYTYNEITVQATGRRSSSRPGKKYERTVRHNDSERVVHYGDPELPMRRNNPDARRNFLSRHNCDSKKDPFAPGFWACLDWARPAEKEGIVNEETDVKMCGEEHKMDMDDYGGAVFATSYSELDAMEEAGEMSKRMAKAVSDFQLLAENIMVSDIEDKAAALRSLADEFAGRIAGDVEVKESGAVQNLMDDFGAVLPKQTPMKTEDGTRYPASDFAFVPDKEKPSTWKLRLSEGKPGNITVAQLGRAAAALSSGGFRGQQVDIPDGDLSAVKRRIRSEYGKLDVKREDMPDSVKEVHSNFMLWKQVDGSYRWLSIYSNKFRDRDNPPEILSEEAHKRFIKEVDEGIHPYPELWHWHTPGTKWGVADWLAYADGFAIASGTVDPGHEKEAEAVAKLHSVKASHGMPGMFIERDNKDGTIITRYVTKEISDLPAWAAANPLTDFDVKGGISMIPDEKKEYLEQVGLTAEQIAEIEGRVESKAKEAEVAGLEFKEVDESETEPVEEKAQPEFVTKDEVAQTMSAIIKTLDMLAGKVGELAATVEAIKETDEEKVAEKAALTPSASLESLLIQSVIGKAEAKVDGRTALAKSGPKETEAPKEFSSFADMIQSAILTQ